MIRLLALLVALLVGSVPLFAVAASPLPITTPADAGFSSERLARLHQTLDQAVDAGRYSGYVVLLARDGKLVDQHAHGWRDVENKAPLAPDSIVRIHSMTKIITSVAILTLMEDGRLNLFDRVEKYLPALKDRKVLTGGTADSPVLVDASRPITINDLLTHTAGYYYNETWSAGSPVLIELFGRARIWEASNLADFVQRVALLPLSDQPGTRFRYGISTDLLGAIVEQVSGRRLDQYFQERILGPLGMKDTAFWISPENVSRRAKSYTRSPGGLVAVPDEARRNVGPDHGILSGGGGLWSTANDYIRFAQMLLNGGQLDGVRILSRKSVELMRQNHIAHIADPHPFGRLDQGFGFGVRMVADQGRSQTLGSPGMFGWDGAASTLVWMDPQERLVSLLILQHFPFDQDSIHAAFANGVYSALEN
jgi:CubicO group peptidase (beta-lactamase class C family)